MKTGFGNNNFFVKIFYTFTFLSFFSTREKLIKQGGNILVKNVGNRKGKGRKRQGKQGLV